VTLVLMPAESYDASAISEILSDWIDETVWMPRIHTRDENWGFGKRLIDMMDVTITRTDDEIVGFLARREQEIHALYLTASARGRGIGTALIERAKGQTDCLGLWTFQANVDARRFYIRNGFIEDQLTDGQGNDEKLPDVHLTWTGEPA